MPKPLNADAITESLKALTGWKYNSSKQAIFRSFSFKDFKAAWGFMNNVAELAEAAQHHPDWHNVYNKVEINLTTHDAGGITEKDTTLAAEINKLV